MDTALYKERYSLPVVLGYTFIMAIGVLFNYFYIFNSETLTPSMTLLSNGVDLTSLFAFLVWLVISLKGLGLWGVVVSMYSRHPYLERPEDHFSGYEAFAVFIMLLATASLLFSGALAHHILFFAV